MRFTSARLPDALMHKGALKITVTVGTGQRFNIWNVHLQAGDGEQVRSRQIAELVRWIQKSNDGQVADIVGGDFNFTTGSSQFRRFVASVGPDVHQVAGEDALPTWDGLKITPGGGQTFDHIFVRIRQPVDQIHASPHRVFEASRREDRLSDHMGLEASLTFGTITEDRTSKLVGQTTPPALLNFRRGTSLLSN